MLRGPISNHRKDGNLICRRSWVMREETDGLKKKHLVNYRFTFQIPLFPKFFKILIYVAFLCFFLSFALALLICLSFLQTYLLSFLFIFPLFHPFLFSFFNFHSLHLFFSFSFLLYLFLFPHFIFLPTFPFNYSSICLFSLLYLFFKFFNLQRNNILEAKESRLPILFLCLLSSHKSHDRFSLQLFRERLLNMRQRDLKADIYAALVFWIRTQYSKWTDRAKKHWPN